MDDESSRFPPSVRPPPAKNARNPNTGSSVPSPAHPSYNRPPLPPLPKTPYTPTNPFASPVTTPSSSSPPQPQPYSPLHRADTISKKPGPKLLIPQSMTSPRHDSIVPTPGSNIDIFMAIREKEKERPIPEMLKNVGADENVQRSPINPFRDSAGSSQPMTAHTPAGNFRWTVKEGVKIQTPF